MPETVDLTPAVELLAAHLEAERNMLESYINNPTLCRVAPGVREEHQKKFDAYLEALSVLSLATVDDAENCVVEIERSS
jgi:hypothetical protein